jgi:hypothetical protein
MMFAHTTSLTLRRSLLALALSALAGAASADVLHVELDTSGFGPLSWIDLQFNPSNSAGAVLAELTLSHLSGFDTGLVPELSGDVGGSAAAGFHFANTSSLNEVFHAVRGKVSFDVSFSGLPDPKAMQSAFVVGLYGADRSTQLGNVDAYGSLLRLDWTASPVAGGQGAVGIGYQDLAHVSVSAVPEPSSWLMLGAGLAALGVVGVRRRG